MEVGLLKFKCIQLNNKKKNPRGSNSVKTYKPK